MTLKSLLFGGQFLLGVMFKEFLIAILFLTVLGVLIPKGNVDTLKESTVFFSPDSSLKIKGKTNVHNFQCEFDMQALSDSISVSFNEQSGELIFYDSQLKLPNFQFDCGGKAINKDFNKLLNSEEYPAISIFLKRIDPLEGQPNRVNATMEIMIGNIVNIYTIPITINQEEGLHLSGSVPLDINDFSLTPPTKLLGAIKVSPIIEIEFSLNVFTC